MTFHLDPASKTPVYLQLKGQVLHALSRGRLKIGDQLPTVRELAVRLAINPNTVNHAYAELERDGVLATRRGRGTFIAGRASAADAAGQAARLNDIARRALGEAKSFGFDTDDLVAAIGRLRREDGR